MKKVILAAFLSGLFGVSLAFAQGQDFSKVEMKVQKVAGTVYMLEGAGGNTRFGETKPADKNALPIITFENDVSVHLNGEDIHAIHIPSGHTDGDAVIFFKQSNVVHMGDDFFNGGMFPFIDIDSGGSVQGMIAGDEKVLAEVPDDVKIIPGHGPLGTKDDLRKFIAVLKETSAAVETGIKKGKTVEQLKNEKVLAKWDAFGQSFIK